MLVKKVKMAEAECIVRGYLEGSALKEYLKTGSICGIKLPAGLLGGFALRYLASSLEEQIGLRALQLASMIAQTHSIRQAAMERDSVQMQSLAEQLREATDASFISIGDSEGVRLAHLLPERIGKPMVGGDNERALELGQSYISKATGSLGPSIRGKAPIFSSDGDILGVVSVGVF
jgi:two-component system CitB family sensor kinase